MSKLPIPYFSCNTDGREEEEELYEVSYRKEGGWHNPGSYPDERSRNPEPS